MTPEEQIDANAKASKEANDAQVKQKARLKALDAAQYLRPHATDPTPFDIVAESEKIYQWLIKDL